MMDLIHSKEMNHPAGRKNKKEDNHYYTILIHVHVPITNYIYFQHKINTL
jgi:hypothetical protein